MVALTIGSKRQNRPLPVYLPKSPFVSAISVAYTRTMCLLGKPNLSRSLPNQKTSSVYTSRPCSGEVFFSFDPVSHLPVRPVVCPSKACVHLLAFWSPQTPPLTCPHQPPPSHLPASTLVPLRHICHTADRAIFMKWKSNHVTSSLKSLHRLLIAQRMELRFCRE